MDMIDGVAITVNNLPDILAAVYEGMVDLRGGEKMAFMHQAEGCGNSLMSQRITRENIYCNGDGSINLRGASTQFYFPGSEEHIDKWGTYEDSLRRQEVTE